jgi:DNA-binding Xre family transcriptional regulator
MQRRIRRIYRRMTAKELEEHKKIRELIEKEKPEIVAMGRRLLAQADRLRETVRRLKAEREAQGITLQELGERTGIGKANLSRLENSRNPNPTVGTLARYAEALGKDLVITLDRAKRRPEHRRGQSATRRNRGGAR